MPTLSFLFKPLRGYVPCPIGEAKTHSKSIVTFVQAWYYFLKYQQVIVCLFPRWRSLKTLQDVWYIKVLVGCPFFALHNLLNLLVSRSGLSGPSRLFIRPLSRIQVSGLLYSPKITCPTSSRSLPLRYYELQQPRLIGIYRLVRCLVLVGLFIIHWNFRRSVLVSSSPPAWCALI